MAVWMEQQYCAGAGLMIHRFGRRGVSDAGDHE